MREAFGPLADSWARDHVMSELGGRTVVEALRDGVSAKEVWIAVATNREIPLLGPEVASRPSRK
jgi:hypothetical protein